MIQKLTDLVIKPYRPTYDPNVGLGPTNFSIDDTYQGTRIDFKITNRRNQTLECSLFRRVVETNKKYPLVVFCHGNTGNRTASYDTVYSMLRGKVNVVSFDFAGCGLSEGQTISLGYYEQDDIEDVLNHVVQKYSFIDTNRIGLWGRCMGAVSCLLFACRTDCISLLVLDTPFAELPALLRGYIQTVKIIPKWAEDYIYDNLRAKIKEQANFDLEDVVPVKKVSKCKMPAIFVHGTQDGVISPQQFKKIYDAFPGPKHYIELETSHNDPRPDFVYQKIANFVQVQFFDNFDLQNQEMTPKHMNPSLNSEPFTPKNLKKIGAIRFNESVYELKQTEILDPIQIAFENTLKIGEFNRFWNKTNRTYNEISSSPQNKDMKDISPSKGKNLKTKMISTQVTETEMNFSSHFSQIEEDYEGEVSEEHGNAVKVHVKMRNTQSFVRSLPK